MPTKTISVPAALYLTHNGVRIFHTYRDDDVDQGTSDYYFTANAHDDDGPVFDVRDLQVPSRSLLEKHPPYLTASGNPAYSTATSAQKDLWQAQWRDWQREGGGQDQAIRLIVCEAIDLGLIPMGAPQGQLSEAELAELGYVVSVDSEVPGMFHFKHDGGAGNGSYPTRAEAVAAATLAAQETFELHRCDNCGKLHTEQTLDVAKDLAMRVYPGGVMPSGECADCGALCYPWTPQVEASGGLDPIQQVVVDSYGNGQRTVNSVADLDEDCDKLLCFLLNELCLREDCHTPEEALGRIRVIEQQIAGVRSALEEKVGERLGASNGADVPRSPASATATPEGPQVHSLADSEVKKARALVLNAPQFFQDPAFMQWLNNTEPKFTWHIKGNSMADDYSDVVVALDPGLSGEGPDSNMPQYIWNQIVALCREHLGEGFGQPHYLVRITNLV